MPACHLEPKDKKAFVGAVGEALAVLAHGFDEEAFARVVALLEGT